MKEKIGNDNIFLDQPSGELTFGKIFKVLKCSLLRMLVYLLIACVIASTISLVLTVAHKTDASISTVISYTNKGIDVGNGPDGQKLSVDRIKSTNVLTKAIKEAGLENVKDLNASNLAPYITMDGVIPPDVYAKIEDLKAQANSDKNVNEQLNSIVYYPNNYILKFTSYDKFGLNEQQASDLVEKIIKAYQQDWNDKYYPAPTVPTTVFEQIIAGTSAYEYVDYYDLFDEHIEPLSRFINNYSQTSFISEQVIGTGDSRVEENVSFSSLTTELKVLSKDMERYNSYVTVNKVFRNEALVKASLENIVNMYSNKVIILDEEKTNIENQIKNIQFNSSTVDKPNGSVQIIVSYPPSYELLQTKLMKKNEEIAENKKLLSSAEEKLAVINNPDAPVGNPVIADALLTDISHKFIDIVRKSQKFVEDYQENGIITADVSRATPISRSNRTTVSNKVILMIFLVGGVVAVIASISVTVVKQKTFAFKKNKERLAAANAENNFETVAVVEDNENDEKVEDENND